MDLRRALEREHSKAQCLKIVDYVDGSRTRFKVLVDLYLAGPYRITQRAAWPLSICVERHPTLVLPHLQRLLDFCTNPQSHDSVRRNTMRLLQFAEIPRRLHGPVLDLSFSFLQNRRQPIAVRVFAMTVIDRLISDKPDLQRELAIILEDEMMFATAAFRSRGSKILRRLLKGAGGQEKQIKM
jgi:hypothetical protein